MVPAQVVALSALPLTPGGKIDRKRLPIVETPEAKAAEADESLEARLQTLWQELLGEPSVALDDNFFALGGHSLLAVQVIVRLESEGYPVGAGDLFEYPTIRTLSEHLRTLVPQSDAGPELRRIDRSARRRPVS
jgi:hypothetical protein